MPSGRIESILIGDESLLVQCAAALRANGHGIAMVVTDNPQIAAWASDAGMRVGTFDAAAGLLADIDYDWLFSAANLRIIPDALWRKARKGAANFHDGPLPRYAGLNTPAWALIEGQAAHGVTWHELTSGIDEGRIYAQQMVEISAEDTALTLNTKCLEAGIATFQQMLTAIENGNLTGTAQDLSQRSYYPGNKRPLAGATLDFRQSAADLSRLVRGLDFGDGYANPLAVPKIRTDAGLFAATRLTVLGTGYQAAPGTVLALSSDGVTIAVADDSVLVDAVKIDGTADGLRLSQALSVGAILPDLGDMEAAGLDEAVAAAAAWEGVARKALADLRAVDLLDVKAAGSGSIRSIPLNLMTPAYLRAACAAAFLARYASTPSLDIAYRNAHHDNQSRHFPGYFSSWSPLRASVADDDTVADFGTRFGAASDRARSRGGFMSDLARRHPRLSEPVLTIGLSEAATAQAAGHVPGTAVTVCLGEDATMALSFDDARVGSAKANDLAERLSTFSSAFAGDRRIADLPLMSPDEERAVLYEWNATAREYERDSALHTMIERQSALTPDAVAVAFRDRSMTYLELDRAANRVAHTLVARGVGPDTLVGLHIRRSPELIVGALAIHKAGGAYVPLDPSFPADRLTLMVEDSRAPVVLTERALAGSLAVPGALAIEDALAHARTDEAPSTAVRPENLAYMIYTSGSTGRPKGVMIEHRNVANFFAGMDDRIALGDGGQPVWLAVTSLSFDISVLELFWTLARGFKVVIHAADVQDHKTPDAAPLVEMPTKALDFGLFYWGNDDGAGPAKYRLLLEGAKFADTNGFTAIWTPERHFHAFGGPYPNPSVTGAAVAAVTRNLSIRAGSCVLPLHHPARVAEEWAVLDNLSGGRVGLAFASGWMPEDFVLRPENAPPHNKTAMLRDIDTVRRLWRGDKVAFDFPGGTVDVVTQPRPVQAELPVWVTSAGNPDTYREAGRLGANVLTHLLGQSIDELEGKIRVYREALAEAGHDPSKFKVTLMLHTLLGADREEVRERARRPMKDYLRSATALIKQYAWAFPAFKKPEGLKQPMEIDLQSLDADELDAILEFAFLRYFEDSGLFGTVDDALARVRQIAAIGVDEVACLIDYGVPSDIVLERLKPLAEVVSRSRALPQAQVDAVRKDGSAFARDIVQHGVTHLQCTPSMARMFLHSAEDRAALAKVRHLFIGGEALSAALLAELRKVTSAPVENMYGPTETTIWSSTATADIEEGVVPLGKPIANTQLYVLDTARHPVAPGMAGELYIGGDGVARGYFAREDLTRERFFDNPFAGGRMYRTGDLVRYAPDGSLQFLGRADYQVKVRGYRIELGEIEARMMEFPGVAEAVVMAREDRADDVRIVGYIRMSDPRQKGGIDEDALRAHLGHNLPDYMIPAHFVTLDAFPLTPNAKVDRKALPKPQAAERAAAVYVAPADTTQRDIADIFQRVLGVERVGASDSFFALGGHSLLAVQAHRELKAAVAPDLAITDLFRFPTVAGLAAHISDRGKSDERLSRVADRAAMRRAAMGDRRAAMPRLRGTG